MKTIAAFFDEPGTHDYPFNVELYRTVYRQLARVVAAKGGELFVVRSQQTYLGGNTFSRAWRITDAAFVPMEGPMTFDLIWNKASLQSDAAANVINDPAFDELATDKWETYQLFPTLHSPSRVVRTESTLQEACGELNSPMLVLKPLRGFGGTGVHVGPREKILAEKHTFPCIVQEFVDTAGSIPGIVEGMHDFRVILLGSDIGLCYVRTPPPGEFTANVSRGGREIEVPRAKIPAGALAVVRAVDAELQRFPRRIYTIDMGLDRSGQWRLFEINTKPGFSPMETGPSYVEFFGALAEYLLKACGTRPPSETGVHVPQR